MIFMSCISESGGKNTLSIKGHRIIPVAFLKRIRLPGQAIFKIPRIEHLKWPDR
jgi:hypothetical protein